MLRAILTALAALFVATLAAHADDDPYAPGRAVIADINRIVAPKGVQETFELTVGGTRQVVNVRGVDRANPILIYVHGGPGSVEMPMAWTFQRGWEDFFTVVQWDQRGAGRSYPLNDPAAIAPTLTLDRYRDDTIELIDQLRSKYGKDRVFLLGHSWGSAVGLSVAAKRPDLLYAYIGMGQLIDWRENERVGFAWTLDHARNVGNGEAVRELEALKPYPGDAPLTIEKADAWRKWAIQYGALAANRPNADFYFDATRLSPEYTPADRKAWGDGSAFTVQTLIPRLSDLTFMKLKRVDVPLIFFLGRHDNMVPATIADAWLQRVQAPKKIAVWFENSAHLPMIEEPGRTLAALLQHARPLATKVR